MQAAHLVLGHVARGTERMDARPPQRLVGVDVPHAGEDALVEEDGLHGRTSV
jgi:hypothetical protein